jgi:CHAT domain-containing protein/tetratricopeptide (TPR) repeat protein
MFLALPLCGAVQARAIISPNAEPRESQTRRTELERALNEIRNREPGSVHEAETLRALGDMAVERHDLAAAERYSWDALALFEKLRPGATDVAAMRSTLGSIYRRRGDLPMARKLVEQALSTYRTVEPAGKSALVALTNLAEIASEQNDVPATRKYLAESLAMLDSVSNHDSDYGARLLDSGRAELAIDERAAAERHLTDALKYLERSGTQRLGVAVALTSLGRLHMEAGELDTARAELRRAIDIVAPIAPGTRYDAEPCYRLALLERAAGNGRLAAQWHARALFALESERLLIGGSDNSRVAYSETLAAYYLDYIDLLVSLGRFDDAFDVSERYRARVLLDAMVSPPEVVRANLPASLAREYERVRYRYDRAFEGVQSLVHQPFARASYARALRELETAHEERGTFFDRLFSTREPSPAASLSIPRTASEIRRSLSGDTALLSYVTTRTRVHLFIVGVPAATPTGRVSVAHRVVSRDPARLRTDLDALMIQLRAHADTEDGEAALQDRLAALYSRLIGPATLFVRDKQRLVIVPDRNLYRVPWAALAPRGSNPLIENFRVMVAPSATYHVQARAQKPDKDAPADSTVIALAGPEDTPSLPSAAGQVPAMTAEVESIKEIFGPSASVLTGPQATEEAAKRVAPQAQILHFAAHAVADEASPLESYIALAARPRAGAENGFLQAWEVMMQMRLRAHLVVLSACDTARGRETAGEGMLGLTHAFHYAGAPQVMASLWPVSDQATAQLMRSFYARIALGEAPDAALRAAQLEMLHGEERSWIMRMFSPEVVEPRRAWQHPYFWAGFQLSGADEGS